MLILVDENDVEDGCKSTEEEIYGTESDYDFMDEMHFWFDFYCSISLMIT